MTNTISVTATQAKPLQGLYDFVRGHLLIVNSVITAATTAVGLLDFFASRLSILPKIIYTSTALLIAAMMCAALFPAWTTRALQALRPGQRDLVAPPLWRRPLWQFSLALLLFVTVLGFISVAKASAGGALASSFDGVKNLQASLLGIHRDTEAIRSGVETANAKLDRIVDSVDPDNPADKCADIDCAIGDGASRKAIEKLIAKGQALPQGYSLGGDFAQLIKQRSPARFYIPAIYAERGQRDVRMPYVTDIVGEPAALKATIDKAISGAKPPPYLDRNYPISQWAIFSACAAKTQGGFTFAQMALLAGDQDLYAALRAQGAPAESVTCDWTEATPAMRGATTLTDQQIETLTLSAS